LTFVPKLTPNVFDVFCGSPKLHAPVVSKRVKRVCQAQAGRAGAILEDPLGVRDAYVRPRCATREQEVLLGRHRGKHLAKIRFGLIADGYCKGRPSLLLECYDLDHVLGKARKAHPVKGYSFIEPQAH
jgi:hypothetical protein